MTWLYQGQPFENPDNYYGMVYEIKNNVTGQSYIGRKYFTSAKTKTVKGKKKRTRVENDWRDYWSSSAIIQAEVEKYGAENFTREIIRLCMTRGETNYYEVWYQFKYDVLTKKLDNGLFAYYNENINVTWTRKNIGKY